MPKISKEKYIFMKGEHMQKNNKSGITLIALVVTIVLNATRGHCEECIA